MRGLVADPRVGARLEVMAGGRYLWIPFAYLSGVRVESPKHLRDIRWMPAQVVANETARNMELGEVLLPTLSPSAWRSDDPDLPAEAVLGRVVEVQRGARRFRAPGRGRLRRWLRLS